MGNNSSRFNKEERNENTQNHSHDKVEKSIITATATGASSNGVQLVNSSITIDGGQLKPLSALYKEDYDTKIVRKLILDRRVAPFYKGLSDPPNEQIAESHTISSPTPTPLLNNKDVHEDTASKTTYTSIAALAGDSYPSTTITSSNMITHRPSSSSLTILGDSKNTPSEGLYASARECPICFLYYPKNINNTRCCAKPICTECFLQIKRPETTFEPATCPYCVEPHFGIVYKSPSISYIVNGKTINSNEPSPNPMSLSASVNDRAENPIRVVQALRATSPGSISPSQVSILERTLREDEISGSDKGKAANQRQSYSFRHHAVVTSDDIRPDWKQRQQEAAMRAAAFSTRTRHSILTASGTGAGHRARLFRDPSFFAEYQQELAGAAAAAGSFVENITSLTSGARHHAARSRDSLRLGGHSLSRTLSSSQDGNHNNSEASARNARPNFDPNNFAYLEAMRNMGADIEELMVMEAVRRSLVEAQDAADKQAQEQDAVSLARRQAAAERAAAAAAATSAKSESGNGDALNKPPKSTCSLSSSQNSESPIIASSSSSNASSSSSSIEGKGKNNNIKILSSPKLSARSDIPTPNTATISMSASANFEPGPSKITLPLLSSHPPSFPTVTSTQSSQDTTDHGSYSQKSQTSLEDHTVGIDTTESFHRNILLPSGASMLSNTEAYGDAASMRTGHITAFSLYSGETGDEGWTMTHPPSVISQPPTSLAPGRPSISVNMDRDTLNDTDAASMSSTRALKSLKSEYIDGGSVFSGVSSAGCNADYDGGGSLSENHVTNGGRISPLLQNGLVPRTEL